MGDNSKCEIAKFIETIPTRLPSNFKSKIISVKKAYYSCGFHILCRKPDKDKWPGCRGKWRVTIYKVAKTKGEPPVEIMIKKRKIR